MGVGKCISTKEEAMTAESDVLAKESNCESATS